MGPPKASDQLDSEHEQPKPEAKDAPIDPKAQDLEEQQRLAADFKPQEAVDGLFVNPLEPLIELAEEFDEVDPRRTKIRRLAEDFPYIRRMKRDGSCGYRALFFGFLLNLSYGFVHVSANGKGGRNPRDLFADLIDKHVQAMKKRGFDEMIFEDWVETVKETTKQLGEALDRVLKSDGTESLSTVTGSLDKAFNDDEKNMELIQYARMATSSWMIVVNPDKVAPFIDNGLSLDKWCNRYIDPASAELEDLSMTGMFDAFMEQAGMKLVVHDLEKGEGDAVHTYEHNHSHDSDLYPSLNVLYRPGHYDLLLTRDWSGRRSGTLQGFES